MTFLQIINAVMRRLRETEVTTYNETEYSTMIADFVNEAKRKVEDAWDWSMLRSLVTVTTSAGTASYELTGTNDRTVILGIYDSSNKRVIYDGTQSFFDYSDYTQSVSNSEPLYFIPDGINANRELKVRIHPTPDDTYTLKFRCVIPQNDLSADATEVSVPADPVIQEAYLMALIERGEDVGNMSDRQADRARSSLADAISFDANRHPDELVWQAV